jgi:Tfp pilus assembly protein PilV
MRNPKSLSENRRGLSRFCAILGAKWDCPPVPGGFRIGSKPHHRRSGFVLLIVMVLMAIATVVIAGWAKIVLVENRQAHAAEDRLQAQWLAESALQRAGSQLIANRHYQGETWQVSAADLGREAGVAGQAGGAVVILVETPAGREQARRVRVQADFPAAEAGGDVASIRVSKQIVFELSDPKTEQTRVIRPRPVGANQIAGKQP